MGGFFGVVSKQSCTLDLFFGVDYHSHLGTKRGGMAVYGEQLYMKKEEALPDPFTILKIPPSAQSSTAIWMSLQARWGSAVSLTAIPNPC